MKQFKSAILLSALIAGYGMANAQTTESGYFIENYNYRYQMNPAFGNTKNYVAVPAIGNLNIGFHGSLHLKDVLYVRDGKTVLFTNPQVSVSEAMKNLDGRKKLGTSDKIDILSAGFKAFGGYNTVAISAVANFEASIPSEFFRLAKQGISNRTYSIDDLDAYANGYAQIAFNHSRDIKEVPGLRVGAALKINIGIAQATANFNRADLTLGQDVWTATTDANIYMSGAGLKYKLDTFTPKHDPDMQPYEYVSGVEMDGFNINGFGLGLDLGATYDWNDFQFSAAVLDLGFIAWGPTKWASTDGEQTFETDAYTFNVDNDADNSFKNELNRMKDNLSRLYNLHDMGEKSSYTRGLSTTLNFGVLYTLPYYRNLKFGLMNTTRINHIYTWTNFRLSANVQPVNWFAADANVVVGTYGAAFGWLLNFNTTGINFFIGMDHTLGKLAKQGVPLNSNGSFNFGLNVPF